MIGVPLGTRVVLRHLLPGGEQATDSLGELAATDSTSVTVRTRRGPVTVDLADVLLAKVVPPTPPRAWRVAAFLRRAHVAVLSLDCALTEPSVRLVGELIGEGLAVVLLDDSDRASELLRDHGLERWAPLVLAAPALGALTPSPEGYAAAHQEIERRLGRRVGTAEVHLTDARLEIVDAARVFGWQARVFTPPS
ncbi:hypothetical protein [Ornithinimicrobium tianjinense]|uniref:Histone acetyltransferase Rv0428c-like SH3 domain-containing protein n=1 Tax=Ornithinimicrobium tianjinense TaxID=1195761 RepID=A0A917F7S5_9MICO|nr:hypothetical protein [Ornithinimicrobium tianjinense]GGF54011.1 hypothetical protein GCM10011366_22310 [Ornithinimicrobium tianjinense]